MSKFEKEMEEFKTADYLLEYLSGFSDKKLELINTIGDRDFNKAADIAEELSAEHFQLSEMLRSITTN